MKHTLVLVSFLLLAPSLFAAETTTVKPFKTDVILEVVPIKARSILAGGTVDALEKPPAEMPPVWTAVVFRIEKVLMGDFEKVVIEEPSLTDQMKKAVKEKEFWKFLIMDFERTDEEGTPKEWFTMAVSDPSTSFGIREGKETSRKHYKISLARVHKNPDSYVLIKSEKI